MKRELRISILIIALTFYCSHSPAQSIYGFSTESAAKQVELERQFDTKVNPANLDEWMKELSAHPHEVGSKHGYSNVKYMEKLFKSWGFKTEVASYYILFPTPKTRELSIVGDESYQPSLSEPEVEEDRTSGQHDEQLPTYNAYSIDGDVTGQLVYVNQGIPRDYEELARRGIDVKGKIVIARYGGSWRGIKPKVAAENGAIGCILYSDPKDDGYARGDVYPDGPFKNEHGVQRGSVQDMPYYPGDPSTPGKASTKDVDRLGISEIETLTKIPVMPISYNDAKPLLELLEGPLVPGYWRGGLPITYHIGPSSKQVRLNLAFNWDIVEAQNIVATMEGSVYPDQWVMRGNHHDGWVNGASDPISGMVALMEEARVVGELAKAGSPPKRTVMYAGWDAEEPGLIGSTEWVEDHAEELKDKLVTYINTDGSSRGFFGAGASHTLEKYINEAIREVKDPQYPDISVSDRRRALMKISNNTEANRQDLRVNPLGSGSDYSPFLQHLGIASMNIGFGGEGSGGEYHSIYDSYDHYTRFKDPGFQYLAALSKVAGRMTLRMANADILPFDYRGLVDNIEYFLNDIIESTDKMRKETEMRNSLIKSGTYDYTLDPTKSLKPPKTKDAVPFINFSPVQNSLSRLKEASDNFHNTLSSNWENLTNAQKRDLNSDLMYSERFLTNEKGLPRRDWYKHKLYAPGFYTGYGVKTLPGIREAIEQRFWDEVEPEMLMLASTLNALAEQIEKSTEKIR